MEVSLQQQIKDLQQLGFMCSDIVDNQFDIMYYYDNDDIEFVINATICIPENYPKDYPKVVDKGELRRNIDWHVFSKGKLCLEHPINMRKFWSISDNQTLRAFADKYIIPFYYEYYHRVKTGKYRNGEYSHGIDGTIEALSDLWNIPKQMVLWMVLWRFNFLSKELREFMPQNEVDKISNEMCLHLFLKRQSNPRK